MASRTVPGMQRRVFGLETEFGLFATSLRHQAGPQDLCRRVMCATGPPNRWIGNGARFYQDTGGHPEYATPECPDPLTLAVHDAAGEVLMERTRAAAEASLREDYGDRVQLVAVKNNTDTGHESFGCHENYLLAAAAKPDRVNPLLTAFLLARVPLCSAGALSGSGEFRISARSAVTEAVTGRSTVSSKPLVNLRDEPHADRSRWRRLHMTSGDSLPATYPVAVRAGMFALVLRTLEESPGAWPDLSCGPEADTLRTFAAISADTALTGRFRFGRRYWSALDVLEYFAGRAARVLDRSGALPWETWAMSEWVSLLDDARRDPGLLEDRCVWAAKLAALRRLRDRTGATWDSSKARTLDWAFHDTAPARSMMRRLVDAGRFRSVATLEDAAAALAVPPATRARARAELAAAVADVEGISVNWDGVMRIGAVVSMSDPFDPVVPDGAVEQLRNPPRPKQPGLWQPSGPGSAQAAMAGAGLAGVYGVPYFADLDDAYDDLAG